jgi:DNA polymerase III sliding clamp (beta) subunit (PCNA family)
MKFTLTQSKKIVKAFAKHSARHDVRYYLQGIHFKNGEMVATDGNRLATLTSPEIKSVSKALDGCTIATTARNLEALAEMISSPIAETELSFDKETGVLKTPRNSYVIDSVVPQGTDFDVRYPDYRRVIPGEIKSEFKMFAYNAKYFMDACSLVSAVHTKYETMHIESADHPAGQPIAVVRINQNEMEGMIIIMPVRV